jgi:hypothetical protein
MGPAVSKDQDRGGELTAPHRPASRHPLNIRPSSFDEPTRARGLFADQVQKEAGIAYDFAPTATLLMTNGGMG